MPYRVLKTKITAPSICEEFLFRNRLIDKILEDKKIICLHAGVGYGKTVLLAQFVKLLEKSSEKYAWIELCEENNDIKKFLICLCQSIKQTFVEFEFNILDYEDVILDDSILHEVLCDFILCLSKLKLCEKQKIYIVLDDLNEITNENILECIDYLTSNTPRNIKFLIATNTKIPYFLGKKMLDDNCKIIHQNELSLNLSEICEIFKLENCDLIYEKTEGWPSAVRFILMFLEENDNKIYDKISFYDKDIVNSYLKHEIFDKFSSETKDFLLYTSLLENLSIDACNSIMSIENSQDILAHLVKQNILISERFNNEENLRYNPLFKEFLMENIPCETKKKIFEKIALFEFKRANYEKCVDVAIESGNTLMVFHIIEQIGFKMLSLEKKSIVKKWVLYLLSADKELSSKNYSLCGKYFYEVQDYKLANKYFEYAMHRFLKEKMYEDYAKNAILKAICVRNINSLELSNEILDDIIIRFRNKDNDALYSAIKEKIFNLIFLVRYEEALALCSEAILTARRFKNKNVERAFAKISTIVYFYMGKYHKALTLYEGFTHLGIDEQGSFSSVPYIATLKAIYGDLSYAKELIDSGIESKLNSKEKQDLWVFFIFKAVICSILFKKTKNQNYLYEALEECDKALESISFCNENHEFIKFIKAILTAIDLMVKKVDLDEISNIELGIMANSHEFSSSFCAGMLVSSGYFGGKFANINVIEKFYIHRNKNIFNIILDIKKSLMLYSQNKTQDAVKLAILTREFLDGNKLKLDFLDEKQMELFFDLGAKVYEINENLYENTGDEKINIVSMGNFEVHLPSLKKSIRFRTKKAKELFAWLFLLQGKSIDKEQILLEMWPESTEKSATNLLHTALYSIRKTFSENGFSDIIQCKNKKYLLNLDEVNSDIFMLSILKKKILSGIKIDEELCMNAISIHKGDFMQDIDCNFCVDSRRYYEKEYLSLLEIITEKCIKEKKYEFAVKSLSKACEIDRYREDYYAGLMECFGKLNNTKMIIDIYEEMKKIFKNELELEISKEVNEIYKNAIQKNISIEHFKHNKTLINIEGEAYGKLQKRKKLS